ncbi:hypothetical protein ACFQ9X_10070 [Catenulispora yoronensis]
MRGAQHLVEVVDGVQGGDQQDVRGGGGSPAARPANAFSSRADSGSGRRPEAGRGSWSRNRGSS